MSFERVHPSQSQSSQSPASPPQVASRPFSGQETQHPLTQANIDNEAFQQNQFETFGLQRKEQHGTITPVEQEKLGVLQAKMDGFWVQRMEQVKAQPNLLKMITLKAQTAQTSRPALPVQPSLVANQSFGAAPITTPALPIQRQLMMGPPKDPSEQETEPRAADETSIVQRKVSFAFADTQVHSLADRISPTYDVFHQPLQMEPHPIHYHAASAGTVHLQRLEESQELGMSPAAWQRFVASQQHSIREETDALDHGKSGSRANEPPHSIQDLAENAHKYYLYWCSNDDVLLGILLDIFEANWFKAKACLTMEQWPSSVPEDKRPPHDIGIKLMQAMVDMRTRKWQAFTDRIKPEFIERMKMYDEQILRSDIQTQEGGGKKLLDIFDAVGSQAVTSDIDLASGGSNSELGVQFVNSKFRLTFAPGRTIPYDPGTVFDINIYASDWIHGDRDTVDQGVTRTITPGAEVENMSAKAEQERTRRIEVWSLVKVRRNMDETEWSAYVDITLDSLTDDTVRQEMQAKLLEADQKYAAFKQKVQLKQAKMDQQLHQQEQAFFNSRPSAFGEDNQEYQEEAHMMRASNAIYEETLVEVKLLRAQIEKLKAANPVENAEEIENLGILLGDKIAEALTYANEVYATEGAVQHTVLQQGASKKLAKLKAKPENQNNPAIQNLREIKYNLKPELYLQAVNENVGDSLHSIHHYHDVPYYAVYRAGKYLARLCDAAQQLLTVPRAQTLPFYEDLELIGENAVRVKATNIAGIEGDTEYVKNDAFFKDYKDSDLSTVRAEIIAFGASVRQSLEEKKRQDQEQHD